MVGRQKMVFVKKYCFTTFELYLSSRDLNSLFQFCLSSEKKKTPTTTFLGNSAESDIGDLSTLFNLIMLILDTKSSGW